MRISDWSSDVCSSDLYRAVRILENYWHYMCHYMSRYARLFDPGAKSGQQGRDGDRVEKIERARDRTIPGRRQPRTRAVQPPAHRRGDDGTYRPGRPLAQIGPRGRKSGGQGARVTGRDAHETRV